ncbi:glycosyltransferase [Undibacterium cyanobacteriorum]|uniref:Glycosyltransferase n=1 Tax=Undibacterium cyanobacteriorum TaxID=3073561 RepID=A0ABY9RIL9_9BURK|nr:glycosyltransferase [Undibacterium sp. 20NA77.5]WMW81066.1 glycosyltransferase [Undibacterium sp. 20NA77.5]
MRLLIDLQACQSSSSRTRGIGRYSIELAKAMVRQGAQHDIHLLLNASFTEAVREIRQIFAGQILPQNIHVWQGVLPCNELDSANTWRLRANELIREQAIREIGPDIVHISSLFEGLSDDAVVSVPAMNAGRIPVAVTLYDLIPLINAKTYLENQQVRAWYYRKAQSLKRADLLLAISESSRQEGIKYLFSPADRVVNISSAVDQRFQLNTDETSEFAEIRHKYGLHREFVMYTGGIDLRKNIEGLIAAYAQLPSEQRKAHQLAIVCSVHERDRERLTALAATLGLASDELVLTGFVPDQDLPKLYHACKLFVFPSWHEGFGLPALEAMSCGAPVIAANTSSLPEVVEWSEAMFDPRDIYAMRAKMQQALEDATFREQLVKSGLVQAKKFSWDASARTALNALQACLEQHQSQRVDVVNQARPRMAYVSPIPPAQSGIADYSAELLPELAAHYDIHIITEQSEQSKQSGASDPWLAANFPLRSPAWFVEHADQFDRVLYHFGNSMFHEFMLDLMRLHPGVVVLHDFYHSGLLAHLDFTAKRPGIWDQALFYSHGFAATLKKATVSDLSQAIWEFPSNHEVLERALGIVVHSEFSKALGRAWYGPAVTKEWKHVPFLRVMPQQIDRTKARAELGVSEDDFLVCSFGILGPTKLNQDLLDAWLASPLSQDTRCKLIFVGKHDDGAYGEKMLETIERAGLQDRVTITGFADLDLFRRYLSAANVAVQLRSLSRGETSGTVFDCLAYGIPTIINKNGAMAELPDGPLIRIEEQFAVADLSDQLQRLWESVELREQYSVAAQQYIEQHHAPSEIGLRYRDAVEDFYLNGAGAALRSTMRNIACLEHPRTEHDVMGVANALEQNRISSRRRRLLLSMNELAQHHGQEHQQQNARIKDFILQLLERLPKDVMLLPMKAELTTDIRIAAQDLADYLDLQLAVAPTFDLEPVQVGPVDMILNFVADSSESIQWAHELELLAQVQGAIYQGVKLPETEDDVAQILQTILSVLNESSF